VCLKIRRTSALEGGVPDLLTATLRLTYTRLTSYPVVRPGTEPAPVSQELVPPPAHRAARPTSKDVMIEVSVAPISCTPNKERY
jgi:hypothetical protein